jgi:acyl transferase domain-containing protein/thioesterase domain-containing protein/aryl carrier-like protein
MAGGSDEAGTAIAVIGVAGRFPGAPDVRTFWRNLREGVESISFFTDEELLAAGESPEALRDPAYVRANGKLDGIDQFDASFWGMSPRDAALFDPQHRLFLEVAWEAFEDAGWTPERIAGPVGVFAASGMSEYMMWNLVRNREAIANVGAWLIRHTGNDTNFLATRVSYELNLKGPSMNVQTACSSSLVAIHLACQSLLNGETDVALAGGSTVYVDQIKGYRFQEGEILSPDGHCRAFDAEAAGTIFSSAVGAVLLKRLDDARRDGDRVLAVVRGSAINNDGSSKVGYLAPSVEGQARVISEALAMSGVHPEEVSYIETHGTGTLIGDPIEISGLTQAYRAETDKKQYCAIGSLKTNIGHAGEAAGVASFIKAVLALSHREIPPSLHYKAPNPQADFENSPFYVNAKLRPWAAPPGQKRIAGITGLGAGGTNAHLILEEAPAAKAAAPAPRQKQLLVLSARSPSALDEAGRRLAAHLRQSSDSLVDAACTLLRGRREFTHRRAIVAETAVDAAAALEQNDPKRVVTAVASKDPLSLVYMFPGGGAQYAGMGAELYEKEAAYRAAIDEAIALVPSELRTELRAVMFPRGDVAEATKRLESPRLALPALLATEYALAKLLSSLGLEPAAMIGHSAGEYAAAVLAGVISLKDGLALVATRGRLFETVPDGRMLGVSLSEAEARALLPEGLSIAAANAPSMCVVSGPAPLVAQMEALLSEKEIDHSKIHINVAAHSSMLEPILQEFEQFCRTVRFSPPKIPFVSNLTGTWIKDSEATDPAYWVKHLRNTVRFGDGIATVLAHDPARALVEIGPGRTLSSLARAAEKKAPAITSTLRHPQEEASDVAFLLTSVGRVWAGGVALDAEKLFAAERRRRVSLPTYPFERQRHWVAPDPISAQHVRSRVLAKRADIADWFAVPSWARSASPPETSDALGPWLVFVDGSRVAEALVNKLRARGEVVVAVEEGQSFSMRDDHHFTASASRRADYDALVAELKNRQLLPKRAIYTWTMSPRVDRWGALPGLRARLKGADEVAAYTSGIAKSYYGPLFLVQALAGQVDDLSLTAISSHMQMIGGETESNPEKAALLGLLTVVPREYPHVACRSVDVDWRPRGDQDELAERLLREVRSDVPDPVVVYRGDARWTRRLDSLRLPPASIASRWLRPRGTYLVTGGLGGIGLEVAEHLARSVRARLVLIGRTPLPPLAERDTWLASHPADDPTSLRIRRVRALEDLGSEVLTLTADVSDRASMEGAVSTARARFGTIHGVFHAAGVLKDELIALRAPEASSAVLDPKAKGALILDAIFRSAPLDLFVLFSSISSLLGLPGQADYTAANAILDALAWARAHGPHRRTVSIDWNAWKGVGMLASFVRTAQAESRPAAIAHGPHPALAEVLVDDERETRFRTMLRRDTHWMVGEHVVHGGEALIPGTGFVELSRALTAHRKDPRPVLLHNVTFLAPFVVEKAESRALHARIEKDGTFSFWGEDEASPNVTGRGEHVDAPPATRHDMAVIRARCPQPGAVENGRLVQGFMDFGPRWANIARIDLGQGEALVEMALAPSQVGDLEDYRLHPGMLDAATGGAQAIIPGFDQSKDFYVPFSYERVLVRRPMPAHFFSHVRLRAGTPKDVAMFDVTLFDAQGDEIADFSGYVMRKVASGFTAPRPRAASGPETAQEAALREAMTPAEGLDALDRMLGNACGPQVVASTVDIELWREQLDAEATSADDPTAKTAGAARPSLGAAFVAPRTSIEKELAGMWRDLLGVAEVGALDDFFELGGQSLVAVRLFNRIRKKYGIDLPLATLFQVPTIAQCAELLRTTLGLPEESETNGIHQPTDAPASIRPSAVGPTRAFRALVPVQRGRDRLPFFCVHGAGGNVLNFRDLSRALHKDQPFYGLQAYGVDGVLRPHETIEAMAASYLEEIREVQPHGPYLLGGYSGGGIVAYEMAQRLTEAGEPVGLLAFIDSFHPQVPLRQLTMRLRMDRARKEGFTYLKDAVRRSVERGQTQRERARIDELLAKNETIPFALRDHHLTVNFEMIASRYVPKSWPGKVTLFRAEQLAYIYQDAGPCYGWDAVALGGVEIVHVPGDHNNILLGSNAEIVVRALGTAITKAQHEARLAPPTPRIVA